MSDLDLPALRKRAVATNPRRDWNYDYRSVSDGTDLVADCPKDFNARFIATFDPVTVLALLDRIDQLTTDLEESKINTIEARNPGINTDRVRADRLRRESESGKYDVSVAALIEAEEVFDEVMARRRKSGVVIRSDFDSSAEAHKAEFARLNDTQALREKALHLAVESLGPNSAESWFLSRAKVFEAYLRGET